MRIEVDPITSEGNVTGSTVLLANTTPVHRGSSTGVGGIVLDDQYMTGQPLLAEMIGNARTNNAASENNHIGSLGHGSGLLLVVWDTLYENSPTTVKSTTTR